MKNPIERLASLVIVTCLVALVCSEAAARWDKTKIVTIKSGPIKPTSGDEPGTLKEVVKLRLSNPPKPPGAPPFLDVTLEILIDMKDQSMKRPYKLTGRVIPRAGHVNAIQLRPLRNGGNGLSLAIDGQVVDSVIMPKLTKGTQLAVTMFTSPFDNEKHPYGKWTMDWGGEAGKQEPPVVLVPYPRPVPIPYPKPPVN